MAVQPASRDRRGPYHGGGSGSVTTYRNARRNRFTALDQRTINDSALSFRARGVLTWLLDKPDDWRTDSKAIAAAGTEGREAIRAALRELEQAGYLVRERVQGDKGRWTTATMVYERPRTTDAREPVVGQASPTPGNPQPGQPELGAPGALPKTETKDLDQNSSEASPPREPKTSKPTKAREPNLVWDAVVEAIGWEPKGNSAKRVGKAIREIREKCPEGATDEQIALAVKGRARRYRHEWPSAELTPEALSKHWERFAPPRGGEKPLEGTAKFYEPDEETRRIGERIHAWHLQQKREAEAKGEYPTFSDPPDGWEPPEEPETAAGATERAPKPRGRRSIARGALRRSEGSEEAAG